MSLSSLVFCIAIQPEVEALDAELVFAVFWALSLGCEDWCLGSMVSGR